VSYLRNKSGQIAFRVGPRRLARQTWGYRVGRGGIVEFPLEIRMEFGEPKVLSAADRLQERVGGGNDGAVKLLEAA
jgi:hypothetical protein